MGSGSSLILAREKSKPIDVSDIPYGDWKAAKDEIARMRELLSVLDPNMFNESTAQKYAPTIESALPGSPVVNRFTKVELENDNAESTDKNASTESRAGQDHWRSEWGTGTVQMPPTGKGKQDKPENKDSKTSFDESQEGQELWSPGRDNSRTCRSAQVVMRPASSAWSQSRPGTGAGLGGPGRRLVEEIRAKTFQRYDSVRSAFLKIDADKYGGCVVILGCPRRS